MSHSTVDEITARVRRLPRVQQEQALAYVRALEHGAAEAAVELPSPARLAAEFAGAIPAADLAAMQAAITADCERVDAEGW